MTAGGCAASFMNKKRVSVFWTNTLFLGFGSAYFMRIILFVAVKFDVFNE